MARLKPRGMPTFMDLLEKQSTRKEEHEVKDMSRKIIRGTTGCVTRTGEHQIDPNKGEDACIICGTMVEDFEMIVADDSGGQPEKVGFCRRCGEWLDSEHIQQRSNFKCPKCGYSLFTINRIGAREKWEKSQ